MSTRKRVIPSVSLLSWRKNFLLKLRDAKPIRPGNQADVALSTGNKKTGRKGKFYKSVLVWNLPSVVTCPGASNWCLQHCYNADKRESVFPVEEWRKNWWMAINQPDILFDNIVKQISIAEKPCAVRIHSSGDFFSIDYIRFWINLINVVNDTFFWAYTRSWVHSELYPYLRELHSVNNLELFASFDETMMIPDHLMKWRRSYVYTDTDSVEHHSITNQRSFICPEQTGLADNCASCGFCIKPIDRDVIFYFH